MDMILIIVSAIKSRFQKDKALIADYSKEISGLLSIKRSLISPEINMYYLMKNLYSYTYNLIIGRYSYIRSVQKTR